MSEAILVIAEQRQNELRDVTFEALSAGKYLADAIDATLEVAVIGGDADSLAAELALSSVETIYTVEGSEAFSPDLYAAGIEAIAGRSDPTYIIAGNTVDSLGYAPAIANRLNRPLVTDTTSITFIDDGLQVTRDMYGSKVETTVTVDASEAVVTIRPGSWEPVTGGAEPSVVPVKMPDEVSLRSTSQGYEEDEGDGVDITDAEVLVSVGRGIEDEENLSIIEELADSLGATIAASRPIVDNGWLPKGRQVGQSGKTVEPSVYIAIGISGAVQHIAGMQESDIIIAINTDPNAPIFDIADYGIVGDLFDVVPSLTEELT